MFARYKHASTFYTEDYASTFLYWIKVPSFSQEAAYRVIMMEILNTEITNYIYISCSIITLLLKYVIVVATQG